MATKNIEKTKSGLKLRTQPKEGALTLRLGTRKYVLPFETRLITSDEYVFIHIPPSAEILKISGGEVSIVTTAEEAEKAVATFKRRRSRGKAAGKKVEEIPSEVKELLEKIPAGYKISYNADGSPKVVKARKRRK